MNISDLQTAISNGMSVVSIVEKSLAAIDGSTSNAIVCKNEDALARAQALDAKKASGEIPGPLFGVPIAVKDNICTKDLATTAASKILKNFVPPYDATVVQRLQEAGAVIVGKANCDEFAMGSSNETSAFGVVKNPVNQEYVPGGSSGGSAAAVAEGICPVSLGSDTGGSIRQPASHCGVVGLKPTYGAVSRFGLIAFASSLDQIGPMSSTVRDSALLFDVIAGRDAMDMTSSAHLHRSTVEAIGGDVAGLRVGVPREYFEFDGGIDEEVVARVTAAIDALRAGGAEIVDISLPHTEYAVATYYLIATAEASSNLARFDGVRYGHRTDAPSDLTMLYEKSRSEGFGDEVKRRIMLGTYVLSAGFYDAYYKKAQQVRALICKDFTDAFQNVDIIVGPTTPTPAFRIGEKTNDPLTMYLEDIFTISCNLAGLPGMSLPVGTTAKKLPVGLQLQANHFDETMLVRVASWLEKNHE